MLVVSTNPHFCLEVSTTTLSVVPINASVQAGLVTLPRREKVQLTQVEFLPLADNRVLVVLVVVLVVVVKPI